MKKQLLSGVAMVIIALCISSCEKEYTCQCQEVNTNTGKVTRTWSPKRGTFTSSSDASTWCHGNETSGFGIKVECELR